MMITSLWNVNLFSVSNIWDNSIWWSSQRVMVQILGDLLYDSFWKKCIVTSTTILKEKFPLIIWTARSMIKIEESYGLLLGLRLRIWSHCGSTIGHAFTFKQINSQKMAKGILGAQPPWNQIFIIILGLRSSITLRCYAMWWPGIKKASYKIIRCLDLLQFKVYLRPKLNTAPSMGINEETNISSA